MNPTYSIRLFLMTVFMLFLCESIYAQQALGKHIQFFHRNKLFPIPNSFCINTQVSSAQALTAIIDSSIYDIDIQNGHVWLTTAYGADHSSDFGTTWSHFDSSNGLGRGGACGLSISNSLITIATEFNQEYLGVSIATGSGISFSTNGGALWTHVSQPIDASADSIISYGINDSLWILPVLVPKQNVTYDVDQQKDTVWIASWAGGLRKTTDRGQHWQRILLPLDDMNSIQPTDSLWSLDPSTQRKTYKKFDIRRNMNLTAFSVAVEDDSTIWCGTAGGVNKSTDGGKSWQKFSHRNQLHAISGNWVLALHIQRKSNQHILWASTVKAIDSDEETGISYTTDNGCSWKTALHGKQSWNISSYKDTVIVPTDHGLYRSADGLSWQYFQPLVNDTLYDAVKDTLGRIWVASSLGVRIFDDNIAFWTSVPAGDPPTIDSIIAPDTLVRPVSGAVICSVKVFASDPQGATDVESAWFKSLKPDGQYADSGSRFFLMNEGNGCFSQTYIIDHNALLGTYSWIFFTEDQTGNLSDSVVHYVVVIDTTLVSVEDNNTQPAEFKLHQNFPNPFNPSTTIHFELPHVGTQHAVSLQVYDLLGREVATLVNERKPAGSYQVEWNATGLPSGIYFYRLQTGNFIETKKLILLK
jgi:hypothetical protein